MKNTNYIFSFGGWVGLAISLVFIIFLDRCQDRSATENKTIEKQTIIYYDSTKRVLPSTSPVITATIPVLIPAYVDTAEILKNYFAKVTYSDQVQDSSIRIQIFDTVSQNKIISRHTQYQWLKPVKTVESVTITVKNSNSGFYVGGFACGNKNYMGVGLQVGWLTKNNMMIGYGYDLINKNHQVSTQFKIIGRTKN